MNKLQNYLCILSFILLLIALPCKAQVTMGSVQPPAKAALLQLKQWETADNTNADDNTNSKKGFGLPNVKLTSLTSLEPFLPATASAEERMKHQGLMVYNTEKKAEENLIPGIYIWTGDAFWYKLNVLGDEGFRQVIDPIDGLIFPSGKAAQAIVTQNIQINWNPSILPSQLSLTATENGGIGWILPNDETGSTGAYTLRVRPAAFTNIEIEKDPFFEKASVLTVVTQNLSGQQITSHTEIRQIHYALQVSGFEPYMELGRNYEIIVASNTNWKIEVSDPDATIDNVKTTLPLNTEIMGDKQKHSYTFMLKNDASYEGKELTLKFVNVDGKYAEQSFTIKTTQTYHNAFMLKKGESVDIPIRKAYAMWKNYIGTDLSGAVVPELVWQDEQGLIQNAASIQLVGGDKGIASVMRVSTNPAVESGNALIGIKVGGEMRWQWHLWVTDYDPDTYIGAAPTFPTDASQKADVENGEVYSYYNTTRAFLFMDRNIGATISPKSVYMKKNDPEYDMSNGTKYYKVLGLVYQAGRNVPVTERLNYIASSVLEKYLYPRSVFDLNGNTVPFNVGRVDKDTGFNLANALKNPMVVYRSKSLSRDWYTGEEVIPFRYRWHHKDNTKGHFDPCPKGWRVPVGGSTTASPYFGYSIAGKWSAAQTYLATTNGIYDFPNEGLGYFTSGPQLVDSNDKVVFAQTSAGFITYTDNESQHLTPTNSFINGFPWNITEKDFGYGIRCVKDVK